MPFRFTAHCIGSDPLNIREQFERFANEQWLPEHATMEEATEIVLDQFKRTVTQALAAIESASRTNRRRQADAVIRRMKLSFSRSVPMCLSRNSFVARLTAR